MGSHKKLTRRDRLCIETMIYDKKNNQEIADRIGVSRTTIDRELQRVPEDLIYNADHAQLDAEMKRGHCEAKSKWTSELAYQIKCDLEDSWSPEQIANARQTVSFKTIYKWIYSGVLNVPTECLWNGNTFLDNFYKVFKITFCYLISTNFFASLSR